MLTTDDLGVLRLSRWSDHDWLVHGFSTRPTGDFRDWPSDAVIASRFGADQCGTAMLQQVHSGRCVRADHAWGSERPAADAVCTNRPGVLVGVRTADCLPVLLVDPGRRAVAAVHAGWRGVVGGVLPNALDALVSEYDCKASKVEAVVGPGIGPCCFEVSEDVASHFHGAFVDRTGSQPHVDLAAVLRSQLRESGVEHVAVAGCCTSCHLGRYYSHRAQQGKAGRMLAVVGLCEP